MNRHWVLTLKSLYLPLTQRRRFPVKKCQSALLLRLGGSLVTLLVSISVVSAQNDTADIKVGHVEIEVSPAAGGALRLSVSYEGKPQARRSIYLADSPQSRSSASGKVVHEGQRVGVKTAKGELLIDPVDGKWTLLDARNRVIIPPSSIGEATNDDRGRPVMHIEIAKVTDKSSSFYGSGGGMNTPTALQQTEGRSRVGNGVAVVPHYWAQAGYATLAVSSDDNAPPSWYAQSEEGDVTWTFAGSSGDLYLMPASNLYEATSAYMELIGRPAVPPRWTFGYLQSRWGWQDRSYIEDTLQQFKDRNLPVDAFIFDFEWYTTEPDYKLKPAGATNFSDFGFNAALFPEPAKQVADYLAQGIHVVGIRKPRIGDSETLQMIHAKGWGVQGRGFEARNLNYQNPDARAWYSQHLEKLLEAGIAGWWNDEGEVNFTTYYYWNMAEFDALAQFRPGARMWAITRAFQPGLQRFPTASWTGDIESTFTELNRTPADILNWSLAGMYYGACDIGGFKGNDTPELLTRWMEAGTFFPVMRSHSTRNVQPRFPWLYGTNAEVAIRKALDLRYRLVPVYYSLAHEAYETGFPLMRPLLMEYPSDTNVANLSSQWLIGRGLMAAPVLTSSTNRSVYLPDDLWYVFDTNTTLAGSRSIDVNAALDETPVYVRAGTILPLAPVLQHTDQLPGGPLELQIYPGKNASFTLVEDDGLTTAYLKGQVRRTTFAWDDADRRLTWKIDGPYAGKDIFTAMKVRVFDRRQKLIEKSLASNGSLSIPN
jgi:alpha-glucosidase